MTQLVIPAHFSSDREAILKNAHGQIVQELTADDVLYVPDWFSTSWVDVTVKKFGTPMCVISDIEGTVIDMPVPYYYFPALNHGMFNNIDAFNTLEFDEDVNTTHCFHFSVMKKKTERYLLLKLVEWFKLDSYQHTWNGHNRELNLTNILQELDTIQSDWNTQELRTHICAPVQNIQPRFFEIAKGEYPKLYQALVVIWKTFARQQIASSAVSVLTESSGQEFEPVFALGDRTQFAIMGLTFPIWLGGYGSAAKAKELGFDTFDDVINHDYQFKSTKVERCYHAMADNIELLSNLQRAGSLRQQYKKRLINNRDHMLHGGFHRVMEDLYRRLPAKLQELIDPTTNYQFKILSSK